MIQAKELRINNLVWLKSKAKIYTISDGHDIDEGTDSDDFEPIPLTEEILLKCGFQKTVYGKLFFENGDFSIGIDLSNGKNIVDLWIEDEECYYRMPMILAEYLHQLQNLVYALTGEELQITL